jgi:hypothetical protein
VRSPLGIAFVLQRAKAQQGHTAALAGHDPNSALRESAAYDLGEDDCIVVVPITGGVDEGECPVTCPAPELFERRQSVTKYSSSLARSHETPRGQSRSIKMR